MTRRILCLLLLLADGCLKPPPAPPKSVRTIAVLPTNNRTGDELLITGGTLLEKYVFHTEQVTVPDVLAAEARTLLEQDGYTLVSPELVEAATGGHAPASARAAANMASAHDLAGDALYIELRQFTPDLTYGPSAIIVALHIDLIDPATGHVLWSADRPPRPIQTQGTINFADAYWIAARAVIKELLAPFAPIGTGR